MEITEQVQRVSGKFKLDNKLHREAINQTSERNRNCGKGSSHTRTAEKQIGLNMERG